MAFLLTFTLLPSHAFVTPTHRACRATKRSSLALVPDPLVFDAMQSTSLQLAEESWRQYVPLAVSLLVITDILLGSPVANGALSALRPPDEGDASNSNKAPPVKDSRERIDTRAVAKQALDKASGTLELRRFLDENKTDMEKMRDVQKQLDEQLRDFDKKQQEKNQN